MAKKSALSSKGSVAKSAGQPTKKPTKVPAQKPSKPAAKAAKSKVPAPGKIPGNPKRITTGSGASVEDIGKQLVGDFNRGKWEPTDKLWSPKVVSIEGMGMAWNGWKSVMAKNADWNSKNAIRGAVAEGPFIGATGFAVKFRMDIEDRASLQRMIHEEVGVYTVKNGKIIAEEFMYGSALPAEAAAPTDHRA